MGANFVFTRRLGVIIVLVGKALLVSAGFNDCKDEFGNSIPNCRNWGRLIGTVVGVLFTLIIISMVLRFARRRRYSQGTSILYHGPPNTLQTVQPPRATVTPPPYDPTYSPNPQAYYPTHISQSSYHQTTHLSDPSLAEPRYHGIGPAHGTVIYSPYQPPPGPPPPPLSSLFDPPPPHPDHTGGPAPEFPTLTVPSPAHVTNGNHNETAPNPTASPVPQYPPPSYSA